MRGGVRDSVGGSDLVVGKVSVTGKLLDGSLEPDLLLNEESVVGKDRVLWEVRDRAGVGETDL